MDAEFGCYFGWELKEADAGEFGVAIAVTGSVDVSAERVGGHGDAVAGGGGKGDVRGGLA